MLMGFAFKIGLKSLENWECIIKQDYFGFCVAFKHSKLSYQKCTQVFFRCYGGYFSVKPINERVQPPPISPEDYKYFIGYLLSINRTNMLDMDCKGGDCQIRIIADGRLVGKFSDGI